MNALTSALQVLIKSVWYKIYGWPTIILGIDPDGNPQAVNVDADGNLIVDVSVTPTGTQDVNLIKVGGTTYALGQQLAAASLPVVLTAAQLAAISTSANQATQITAEQAIQALLGGTGLLKQTPASSATLATVASSASNVTLAASNANRRGLLIFNDSTQIVYVKFGATATSSSYTVQMAAGSYYEMPQPIYTGIVDGIWASANGNARVTELA